MSASSPPPLTDVSIRSTDAADIPEILRQRRAMYEDMGYRDEDSLETMLSLSAEYLTKALADGSFRAWLAISAGRIAGGGAVLISSWPPHPYDLECRRATILNVYTYPDFRRRGIARQVMQVIVDWCRGEGFARVNLHASKFGRPLYESLGFEVSNEMRLPLRQGVIK